MSELTPMWEGGAAAFDSVVPHEGDTPEPSEAGRSARSQGKAKAKANTTTKPARSKKSEVKTLSSSFTSWQKTPESSFCTKGFTQNNLFFHCDE